MEQLIVPLMQALRDSVTEMVARLTLMASAGPAYMISSWDAQKDAPLEYESKELARIIEQDFLREAKKIRLPVTIEAKSGIAPISVTTGGGGERRDSRPPKHKPKTSSKQLAQFPLTF